MELQLFDLVNSQACFGSLECLLAGGEASFVTAAVRRRGDANALLEGRLLRLDFLVDLVRDCGAGSVGSPDAATIVV